MVEIRRRSVDFYGSSARTKRKVKQLLQSDNDNEPERCLPPQGPRADGAHRRDFERELSPLHGGDEDQRRLGSGATGSSGEARFRPANVDRYSLCWPVIALDERGYDVLAATQTAREPWICAKG